MAWDEKLPGNARLGIKTQESWFADGSAVRFRADDGEVDELFGYRVGDEPAKGTAMPDAEPVGIVMRP